MSSTTQPVTKKRSIPDEAPQHLRRKSPIAPFSWTACAWTLKRRRWRRSNNQISWWLPSADGNIQIVHSCRCPWNLKFNWWFSLWQAMTSFFVWILLCFLCLSSVIFSCIFIDSVTWVVSLSMDFTVHIFHVLMSQTSLSHEVSWDRKPGMVHHCASYHWTISIRTTRCSCNHQEK